MEGGDRAVIVEPMVPADDAEADDVSLVVEDLEALGAGPRGEAGDHVDLSESADVAVSDYDLAALEEVLVGLGVVEAADDGPDGGDGGGDGLGHRGAALVGAHRVGVVVDGVVWDGYRRVDYLVICHCWGDGGGSGGGVGGASGGVGGVDSLELKRRRHFYLLPF